MNYLYAVAFIVLAPLVGGLIAGIDRKVTARMQGRVGPPLLQPFYDLGKLLEKEHVVVALSQNYFVLGYLVFNIFAGALFFAGGDLLLVVFAFTLADVLLVLGAYAATSPYSFVGAERELIQLMAYEPMVILAAAGFYIATGSFFVTDIASFPRPLIVLLPG
ncbi:MAG: NADH-quinone oxidoreductase subunit H, partial [Methanospirillum sp.]